VRYAQLSYLWAALVLGKAAWQWLAARARRPARLLAAFGLGALTWYVGTETYRLQVAAGEDREAQELAHEIDQDSRPPTWSLADLPWKAVAPCQQEATADGAIRLTTSHGDYEIQILAQINDPAAATACVAYELEVKRGIVAVGVLDSFGQWVWQNGYRAGVHRQEVPFGASGRGKWTLVVMNSLPDRGVSEVVIRKMDVFLAPP
jgi:hypothetical protein